MVELSGINSVKEALDRVLTQAVVDSPGETKVVSYIFDG